MKDLRLFALLIALGFVAAAQQSFSLSPTHLVLSTRNTAGKVSALSSGNTKLDLNTADPDCVSAVVSINVSATNLLLDFAAPEDTIQNTQDLLSLVSANSTLAALANKGNTTLSDTFDIFYTLCLPYDNHTPASIQFLTHGLAFDHTYWDWPNSSYTDAARSAGYATFSYDRVGTGHSSKPDAVSTVQAPLHVAVAETLLCKLRDGEFGGRTFNRTIAVGHSYGSGITSALLANPANRIDAAVLTGYSRDSTGLSAFGLGLNLDLARNVLPALYAGAGGGVLMPSNAIGWRQGFFTAPNFADSTIDLLVANGSTLTWGEELSRAAIVQDVIDFTGPVLIINGDADLPYCGGNCSYPTNKPAAALAQVFTSTVNGTTILVPGTGHALNLHSTAGQAYQQINEFLKDNGL